MTDRTLCGRRILVAEDEYMLADEMQTELAEAGAVVVGPAATLARALTLLSQTSHLDGAILDINLGGEMAYPLADLLLERGTPVVFTTGYDAAVIPGRFGSIPRCEKPIDMRKVAQAIGRAMRGAA